MMFVCVVKSLRTCDHLSQLGQHWKCDGLVLLLQLFNQTKATRTAQRNNFQSVSHDFISIFDGDIFGDISNPTENAELFLSN